MDGSDVTSDCTCGRPLSDVEARMLPVIRERDELAARLRRATTNAEDAEAEVERLHEALNKPLRETILAVLRTMPAEAAPEHLAAMIERQVQGWQARSDITALPSVDK